MFYQPGTNSEIMKMRTRWIGLGLAAVCACWATNASALITWWGPMDANELPAVGENVLGTSTPDISAAKMAEIENAVNNAGPAPVGEGPGTDMVLHVWPVGNVGPNRIIYVPVSGAAAGRVAVTRTTTTAPVGERVVTTRTTTLSPVGERVTTTRVIHHHYHHHYHTVNYSNY